jgi:dihydrolipoamide dehydrogenase
MGVGKLTGPAKVSGEKDGKPTLSAKHIIIATGARARDLPGQSRRQAHLDLSPRDDAQGNAEQAAGDRFGRHRHRVRQLLQRHGREVTVVEMMDRIVPVEDADVSAFLEKALKKQGMTIMTGAGVEGRLKRVRRPA